jgi:hypothetical protein
MKKVSPKRFSEFIEVALRAVDPGDLVEFFHLFSL